MAFMIAGKHEPIYELDLSGTKRDDVIRASLSILFGALDIIDVASAASTATYLKCVDRHNEQMVSAYVTPGGAKLLLLHSDTRNEEGVRLFLTEAHDLYIKVLLNPLYAPGARIESRDFDARLRALARRHLSFK